MRQVRQVRQVMQVRQALPKNLYAADHTRIPCAMLAMPHFDGQWRLFLDFLDATVPHRYSVTRLTRNENDADTWKTCATRDT